MERKIIIGSRGSRLALWQANFVQTQLQELGLDCTIKIIKTKGDRIQHLSFDKIEGKGFFTKELESALLQGEVDLAVHSYKDLPTVHPEGLVIAATSYRESPADWLLINKDAVKHDKDLSLKEDAVVGTSSARRKAQLWAARPDLSMKDIRGNVPKRIAKLLDPAEKLDAIVLAAAGLKRLNLDLSQFHIHKLSLQECIPAAAQGVLALQIREDDDYLATLLQGIHDEQVADVVSVERAILKALDGGCQQPIGIYCTKNPINGYQVWAVRSKVCTDFPQRIFIEDTCKETIIEQVVNLLKGKGKTKKVFISRDLDEHSFLKRALKNNGHTIHAQSLIEFSPLPLGGMPSTDWIFFSSKKGVEYFFEQNPPLPKNTQIAAIGNGTAKLVKKYGYQLDFVGEGTCTMETARQFGAIAQEKSVLFPQAEQSLQTIQNTVGSHLKVHNLPIYRNQPRKDFSIDYCDILIFTSPVNAETYVQYYPIQANQKVVAIGKTTAKALEKLGCKHYTLAPSTDEVSLADVCH